MTNTESRNAVELEELAAWDDTDALEHDGPQSIDVNGHKLAVYGLDSDSRTLVGLGPVERARRSRPVAETPDSQRMPHSEPPGPFIADDSDSELGRALRGPQRGPWTVAVPALVVVVAAAAVAMVRGLGSDTRPALRPAVAAVAPRTRPAAPQPTDIVGPSESSVTVEAEAANRAQTAPTDASAQNEGRETQLVPTKGEVPARAAAGKAPVAPLALPVKLPELAPPTVIDMAANGASSVGTLNVGSSPPSSVVLDGRPLGQAPRVVQVPAGVHTVVFIHPLYGRQSRRVNVAPGQTASAFADF